MLGRSGRGVAAAVVILTAAGSAGCSNVRPPTVDPAAGSPPPVAVRTGSATVPAQILDLRRWKLTLPVPRPDSDEAAEVRQPELAGYAVDPYFTVSSSGDGVAFRAHAGGATTSGSRYPRSELREMTPDGLDEAAWSARSGTHTMTVRLAVTRLTTAKPEVTVAQVHDDEDDVVVVRLDGPHHLYAEHDGDSIGVLDPAYRLGTRFTVQFVAADGRLRLRYNGEDKVELPAGSRANDFCDACEQMRYYFKAGCYLQSNPDRGEAPDEYAEVVVYELAVTHEA